MSLTPLIYTIKHGVNFFFTWSWSLDDAGKFIVLLPVCRTGARNLRGSEKGWQGLQNQRLEQVEGGQRECSTHFPTQPSSGSLKAHVRRLHVLQVGTVERFQDEARRVILLSTICSSQTPPHAENFVKDEKVNIKKTTNKTCTRQTLRKMLTSFFFHFPFSGVLCGCDSSKSPADCGRRSQGVETRGHLEPVSFIFPCTCLCNWLIDFFIQKDKY